MNRKNTKYTEVIQVLYKSSVQNSSSEVWSAINWMQYRMLCKIKMKRRKIRYQNTTPLENREEESAWASTYSESRDPRPAAKAVSMTIILWILSVSTSPMYCDWTDCAISNNFWHCERIESSLLMENILNVKHDFHNFDNDFFNSFLIGGNDFDNDVMTSPLSDLWYRSTVPFSSDSLPFLSDSWRWREGEKETSESGFTKASTPKWRIVSTIYKCKKYKKKWNFGW